MGKIKYLLTKLRQIILKNREPHYHPQIAQKKPTTVTDFKIRTTDKNKTENKNKYEREQTTMSRRIEKDVLDDELRRKMHQDLIDSHDEELENEIDDYMRDFHFDDLPVNYSRKA